MKLSKKVQHVLASERISEAEFNSMVHLSSPLKDKKGNRRFHHWAFDVVGDECLDMFHVERPPYQGTGQVPQHLPCHECGGEGCNACGYHGEVLHLV